MEALLMEVSELRPLVEAQSVVVLDTRAPEAYRQGHIPGAINVHDIFTYLMTADNGGLSAMVQHFSTILGEAGVSNKDHVVIYEDTLNRGYGQSCRGSFLLRYLGHHLVSVLHGGYLGWVQTGYPLDTSIPVRKPTVYQYQLNDSLILTMQQMQAALDDQTIVKLDCRDWEEWAGLSSSPYGIDFAPRKGRIPGAVWLEWTQLIEHEMGIPRFRANDEILALCEAVGITPDKTVYVYCFKGSRSSNTMLALQKAGIPHVRNYFGSWNEWSRNFDLPIDNRILSSAVYR